MVSFTLKVILHGEENDSKYRDIAPLKLPLLPACSPMGALFLQNLMKPLIPPSLLSTSFPPPSHLIQSCSFWFFSQETNKQPPGRPREPPKEPSWKKEVREAREKKQHTEEKVRDGKVACVQEVVKCFLGCYCFVVV